MDQDLIVVGSSPAALSLAVEAERSGVFRVLVLATDRVVPADAAGRYHLRIHHVEPPLSYRRRDDGVLIVESTTETLSSKVVVIEGPDREIAPPSWDIDLEVAPRVMTGYLPECREKDILVVGSGDEALQRTWQVVEDGGRPVLCLAGRHALSVVGRQLVEELERLQLGTVLYRSLPERIYNASGLPMVVFDDRRTPDLVFDYVLVAGGPGPEASDSLIDSELADSAIYVLGIGEGERVLTPTSAWYGLARHEFPAAEVIERPAAIDDAERVTALRASHYNATITGFDTAHNELWRVRVRPDAAGISHRAGQYCTLGLGYWEQRADDARDPIPESARDRLIRRSYSISSSIFDDYGYLIDVHATDDVELYIVSVRPQGDKIPALTPRLALKQIGDRVYLGPKISGRYTLDPVTDPAAQVVFLATGTGEAPHNSMITELLRKGHHGPILSVVSVRYRSDLAYLSEHSRLEGRFANYSYLPVPTREPDVPKRYIQDLLLDGSIDAALGEPLDSRRAHVFVCGNPRMIGLPEWGDDGDPVFPTPLGAAEILMKLGFTLDRRGQSGNVHYEEFW